MPPKCHPHDSGALAKLTWSGEKWIDSNDGYKEKDAQAVTLDMNSKEADFSNKHLGVSGAIILAAFIKRKSFQDNGALSKLDITQNSIQEGQLGSIRATCTEKLITVLDKPQG